MKLKDAIREAVRRLRRGEPLARAAGCVTKALRRLEDESGIRFLEPAQRLAERLVVARADALAPGAALLALLGHKPRADDELPRISVSLAVTTRHLSAVRRYITQGRGQAGDVELVRQVMMRVVAAGRQGLVADARRELEILSDESVLLIAYLVRGRTIDELARDYGVTNNVMKSRLAAEWMRLVLLVEHDGGPPSEANSGAARLG